MLTRRIRRWRVVKKERIKYTIMWDWVDRLFKRQKSAGLIGHSPLIRWTLAGLVQDGK